MAKLVAEASGLPYLDTGAMYRCVALQTLRTDVNPSDPDLVGDIASKAVISVEGTRAALNGEDVSSLIRTADIAAIVSTYSCS